MYSSKTIQGYIKLYEASLEKVAAQYEDPEQTPPDSEGETETQDASKAEC